MNRMIGNGVNNTIAMVLIPHSMCHWCSASHIKMEGVWLILSLNCQGVWIALLELALLEITRGTLPIPLDQSAVGQKSYRETGNGRFMDGENGTHGTRTAWVCADNSNLYTRFKASEVCQIHVDMGLVLHESCADNSNLYTRFKASEVCQIHVDMGLVAQHYSLSVHDHLNDVIHNIAQWSVDHWPDGL
jgi:hypothetical protein